MRQAWIFLAASWFPFIVAAALTALFIGRRLWRQLPLFFFYLVFVVIGGLVRYFASHIGGRPYFYVYWISDLLASVVAFLPMYEVLLKRMFPRFYKTPLYRSIFPALAVAILVLTIITALESHDRSAAFRAASHAFDFMRTSVLVVLIGLVMVMGRQWTRFDLGITLGFAVQAAVALANAAISARLHYRPTVLDLVDVGAYDVSCLIWLITFLKPDNRAQTNLNDHVSPEMLHEARTWESMLKAWLTPGRTKK